MNGHKLLETVIEVYRFSLTNYPTEEYLMQLPGCCDQAKYRYFLYFLIKELQPKMTVELGTDNGSTAKILGVAAEALNLTVVTVEIGYRDDADKLLSTQPNVRYMHHLNSIEAARMFGNAEIGLLFMDTDHTYETTSSELKLYRPKLAPFGVICVDDIMLHNDMRRFWREVEYPKLVLNELHTQHLGSTNCDGIVLNEGTGFGVILPDIESELLSGFKIHPEIGGYIVN